MTAIERMAERFELTTSSRSIDCEKLVLTTGGKSYPGCGTTGDGYRWLVKLGHSILRPRPALVPLTSDDVWVRDLKGITVSDVRLRVVDPSIGESSKGKRRRSGLPPGVRIERRGSMLFTHFGLSGPAPLDVSRAFTDVAEPRKLVLAVDFLPDAGAAKVEQQFREFAAQEGKRLVAGVVADRLPRRLVDSLLVRAEIAPDLSARDSRPSSLTVVDHS